MSKTLRMIAVGLVVVLALGVAGCSDAPRMKRLTITNGYDSPIERVSLRQYVQSDQQYRVVAPNALAQGQTVQPGDSVDLFINHLGSTVSLTIIPVAGSYDMVYFTYDYMVDGRNETIHALFNDQGEIVLEGSNATIPQ